MKSRHSCWRSRTVDRHGAAHLRRSALPHRHNVEVFETQLPDFVCAEKINSRTVAEKDGSVEKETVIQSRQRTQTTPLSKLAACLPPRSRIREASWSHSLQEQQQKMRRRTARFPFRRPRAGSTRVVEIIRLESESWQGSLPVRVSASARRVVAASRARRVRREYSDYRNTALQHDPLPDWNHGKKNRRSGRWQLKMLTSD